MCVDLAESARHNFFTNGAPQKYQLSTAWWNWMQAFMTTFAQRFDICYSKFERSMAPIAPPGYAPGNND